MKGWSGHVICTPIANGGFECHWHYPAWYRLLMSFGSARWRC